MSTFDDFDEQDDYNLDNEDRDAHTKLPELKPD